MKPRSEEGFATEKDLPLGWILLTGATSFTPMALRADTIVGVHATPDTDAHHQNCACRSLVHLDDGSQISVREFQNAILLLIVKARREMEEV